MRFQSRLVAVTATCLVFASACPAPADAQSVADPPLLLPSIQPAPQTLSAPFLVQAIADSESSIALLTERHYRLEQNHSRLLQERQESLAVQDAMSISSASFDEVLRLLQTQRVMLMIDLAGLDARMEAMTAGVEKAPELPDDGQREIVEHLHELVALERERLQQAQAAHEQGIRTMAELNLARQCLVNAEIRLAEARAGHRGEATAQDGLELTRLSLDRAEKTARLAKVNELSSEMLKARGSVESATEASEQLRAIDAELNQSREQLITAQSRLEIYRNALKELQKRASETGEN